MSAFLGPVHYWLFNKIRLFEELEKSINSDLVKNYGEKALSIVKEMEEKYGEFIPEMPLENLIDTNNIHGWLQNRISVAETRHAATVKNLIDRFGKDVIHILEKNYIGQGSKAGNMASQEADISNAPALYHTLNNYLLEGMPCDNVNSVVISEPTLLQWNTFRCLHKPYWDMANMDADIMYHLRFAWIKAFIESANNQYIYKNQLTPEGYVHQILEK